MESLVKSKTNSEINKSDAQVLKSWKKQEPYTCTSDEVIDAYLRGKIEGIDYQNKILFLRFSDNMHKITSITSDLLKKLKEIKLETEDVYLKIVDINEFELLLLTNLKYYENSDLLIKAYKLNGNIKKEYNNDTFHLSISYVPLTENIDIEHIKCDGFGLKYAESKQVSLASKA
ncbi:MAG: hypothetical protein EPN82_07285 [Bacteroidetes bacterium]|nr:MAG: hypothetical protein EPN82_07285 [Bacteroidota bacterium]